MFETEVTNWICCRHTNWDVEQSRKQVPKGTELTREMQRKAADAGQVEDERRLGFNNNVSGIRT